MQIKDIAEVMSGYSFRGAIEKDPKGEIFVVQAKDIVSGEIIKDVNGLIPISSTVLGTYKNLLQMGDVLVVSRGMKTGIFRSTVFKTNMSDVIASSSVHIIRINDNKVLPEYLSHYLNSKHGQVKISQNVSGSYIGSLSKVKLYEMEIPVPELNKQKTIIDLHENMKRQRIILKRKIDIKDNIINATFSNLVTN